MTRLSAFLSISSLLVFMTGCTIESLATDIRSTSHSSARYGSAYNKKKKEAAKRPRVSPTKKHEMILAKSNKKNTKVVIDIGNQKGYLLVNGSKGAEFPVSTARSGKYTPRGTFRVSERVRTGKVSTIYGVEMPYWQRLSGTVFGVHAGYLPGYPASAGCIRLPSDAAQLVYDHMSYGAPVSIVSSWAGL